MAKVTVLSRDGVDVPLLPAVFGRTRLAAAQHLGGEHLASDAGRP